MPESTDHIFFSYTVARFLKDVFGWQLVPVSVSIFQKLVLDQADCKNKQWLIFFFGCAAWCLWLIRNDFVFNNVVISSPEVCLFRTISYMQRWEIMCKEEKQLLVAEAIHHLKPA